MLILSTLNKEYGVRSQTNRQVEHWGEEVPCLTAALFILAGTERKESFAQGSAAELGGLVTLSSAHPAQVHQHRCECHHLGSLVLPGARLCFKHSSWRCLGGPSLPQQEW